MKKSTKYLVTAALPYANGPIHIGHLSGVYLPADVFVRFLRKKKKNVLFISGSDEHGVPIAIQAKKEKKTPKEIVNKYHYMIHDTFINFGIQFDNYSRTTTKIHYEISTSFFIKFHNKEEIFEKISYQYYDDKYEQFLSDRYISGICPHCKKEEAYGDQCEYCGSSLIPEDLINPKSTISGATPILKKTKHWYLPLNKYQEFLENWILIHHKKDWKVNVYGQAKSWLKKGLEPRPITRDLNWGVPVPIKKYKEKGKVLYVWFEAPIGYISSTIEWSKRNKIDWKSYWKDKKTKLIQFIGKDNIVFHCIIFPIILKAYNDGYILPDKILANEFLNLENRKISTSKNWAVWVHEYLVDFPNQQDALRYVLIANMPEKKDNNFNWKDFQRKNNTELVAVLGNFINRSLTLVKKYNNGIVPNPGILSIKDKNILEEINNYPKIISISIESYKFKESLSHFMKLARIGNKYLTEEEPWKKTKKKRLYTILYVSIQIVAMLSQLAEPFLPHTAKKLLNMLRLKPFSWDNLMNMKKLLYPGHLLGNLTLLFKKITNESIDEQIKKLNTIHKKKNDKC
ncbi:methionine--tRNA ligase [Blattabacterium cuenoti]|uniref:methionine--tRNA ligase n=1 Tax=Blattabacterium cuenoti TaxID=1653831 RepID=UPI00163C9CEC|nr:methionine--tRNA ligase [Blattabacterium cuenoti]